MLKINASARKVTGGPGSLVHVDVFYRNATDDPVAVSRSSTRVDLLADGRAVDGHDPRPVPDSYMLPPGGTAGFDVSFHTDADVFDRPHLARCYFADETATDWV